ncbi:MAG: hypothetical protein ACP5FQ_07710 [Thermoplasmata archaeon]
MLSSNMNFNYGQMKKKIDNRINLFIIIKVDSVEFSSFSNGYQEIGKNIFMDHLPYLIFFSKIPSNNNLKESFKWSRKLILRNINKEISKLSAINSLQRSKEMEMKIKLLTESILRLQKNAIPLL